MIINQIIRILLRFTSSVGMSSWRRCHWWEEHCSDRWDCSLETKVDSVVNRLGAYDSAFLGKQPESSDAPGGLVVFNALKILGVDCDLAWNVFQAFSVEADDLVNNHLLVSIDSFVNHRLDQLFVALSASQENLSFHEFDETLSKLVFCDYLPRSRDF